MAQVGVFVFSHDGGEKCELPVMDHKAYLMRDGNELVVSARHLNKPILGKFLVKRDEVGAACSMQLSMTSVVLTLSIACSWCSL